jgi:hypothetical protein
MGSISAAINNARLIVELSPAKSLHSHAAKSVISPIANEKYSIGSWNTASAIRVARTDAVIIRFSNIFISYK